MSDKEQGVSMDRSKIEKSRRLTFRFTPEEVRVFEYYSTLYNITKSQLIRNMLRDILKEASYNELR